MLPHTIQGDSEEKVNILGSGISVIARKKSSHEHVSKCDWLPRYSS